MATATVTATKPGEVAGSVALGTSEGTLIIKELQAAARAIQLVADADWLYCHVSGGTFMPVKANQPLTIPVLDNPNRTFYAKVASGTATLYCYLAV